VSELERRLLANLTDNHEMGTAWELGLRSVHFTELVCKAMFDFMVDYWHTDQQRMMPTLSVLAKQFPGIELPIDEDLSTTWATEQLKNDFANTAIQEKMLEGAKIAHTDPQEAVRFLRSEFHSMAENVTPRYSRSDMALNIVERRTRYLERAEGQRRGVTLGIPALDDHVGGLLPGELCVVGAYSKTGKTMWLANVAIAARRSGIVPIFFSLEMPKEEIEDRLDAMFSGISYDRLSKSKLNMDEMRHLAACQEELADLGGLKVEAPEEGDRTVAAIVNRARYADALLPIIDQLSFMEPGRSVRDLKEHHSVIMRGLKAEIGKASAGKVPCVLAVQFNRESQRRHEGVGLDSFANATEVEATSDLCLGLWRNAEMEKANQMQMKLLGARRSRTASWLLNWHLYGRTEITMDRVLTE